MATKTSDVWVWPNAMVTRVVDGDTFIARLTKDIGFHGTVTFEQRLRLNGINAPKASSVPGKAAAKAATALLQRDLVTITTLKPYKYGDEWMADVVLADGTNVSDWLVANGYAVAWDGTGSRPDDS